MPTRPCLGKQLLGDWKGGQEEGGQDEQQSVVRGATAIGALVQAGKFRTKLFWETKNRGLVGKTGQARFRVSVWSVCWCDSVVLQHWCVVCVSVQCQYANVLILLDCGSGNSLLLWSYLCHWGIIAAWAEDLGLLVFNLCQFQNPCNVSLSHLPRVHFMHF